MLLNVGYRIPRDDFERAGTRTMVRSRRLRHRHSSNDRSPINFNMTSSADQRRAGLRIELIPFTTFVVVVVVGGGGGGSSSSPTRSTILTSVGTESLPSGVSFQLLVLKHKIGLTSYAPTPKECSQLATRSNPYKWINKKCNDAERGCGGRRVIVVVACGV